MGKSENGPDMLDCIQYLREIEESQTCGVTLMLEPDGWGAGPRWRIHVLGVPRIAPLVDGAVGTAAYAIWPHREHKTFEGAVFAALAKLDAEFGRKEYKDIVGLM